MRGGTPSITLEKDENVHTLTCTLLPSLFERCKNDTPFLEHYFGHLFVRSNGHLFFVHFLAAREVAANTTTRFWSKQKFALHQGFFFLRLTPKKACASSRHGATTKFPRRVDNRSPISRGTHRWLSPTLLHMIWQSHLRSGIQIFGVFQVQGSSYTVNAEG